MAATFVGRQFLLTDTKNSINTLTVACYNVEKMVDLLLIVHRNLRLAGVTGHGVEPLVRVHPLPRPALPFLHLHRELHLRRRVHRAVDHKHGAVLRMIHLHNCLSLKLSVIIGVNKDSSRYVANLINLKKIRHSWKQILFLLCHFTKLKLLVISVVALVMAQHNNYLMSLAVQTEDSEAGGAVEDCVTARKLMYSCSVG